MINNSSKYFINSRIIYRGRNNAFQLTRLPLCRFLTANTMVLEAPASLTE